MQEEWLNIKQVAEILQVSPQSVWNWKARGDIPSYYFGKRLVRFKKSDIDDLFEKAIPKKRGK